MTISSIMLTPVTTVLWVSASQMSADREIGRTFFPARADIRLSPPVSWTPARECKTAGEGRFLSFQEGIAWKLPGVLRGSDVCEPSSIEIGAGRCLFPSSQDKIHYAIGDPMGLDGLEIILDPQSSVVPLSSVFQEKTGVVRKPAREIPGEENDSVERLRRFRSKLIGFLRDVDDTISELESGAESPLSVDDLLIQIGDAFVDGLVSTPNNESGHREWARRKYAEISKGAGLTEREEQVLNHLLTGSDLAMIAEELGIKERTVKFHAHNAFEKIGADNHRDLLRLVHNSLTRRG